MDFIRYQLGIIDREIQSGSILSDLLYKSPLLFCASGLIAGIVIQDSINQPIGLWAAFLAVITVSAIFAFRLKPARRLIALCVFSAAAFACIGAMRLSVFNHHGPSDINTLVGASRTLATVKGIVSSGPILESHPAWAFQDFVYQDPGTSFYLDVTYVQTDKGFMPSSGTVRVQVAGPVLDLELGDSVLVYCWLDRFEGPLNPGQFDVKRYLAQRGVHIAAFVKTVGGVVKQQVSAQQGFSVALLASKIARAAKAMLLSDSLGEEDSQAMLSALVLGCRAEISPKVNLAFSQTGLLHILALSGGHVATLIGVIWFCLCPVLSNRRARAMVCLVAIGLFTLAVPAYAPVLRASVIGVFFCVSILISRRPNSINTLALAAIVLILFRPLELMSAGWQLSFACVLGILLFTSRLEIFAHDLVSNRLLEPSKTRLEGILKWFSRTTVTALCAGTAAMIGGAGIMLYHFYTITPLGIIWTILVLPIVSVVLVLGFIKLTVGALLPTLSGLLSPLLLKLCAVFTGVVEFFASIDSTQILVGKVPIGLIVLFYAFVLFAAFFRLKRKGIKAAVTIVTCLLITGWIFAIKTGFGAPKALELDVLAVGHGQCAVVKTPCGKVMVFDAGSLSTKDAGNRVILPYLNSRGITKIDAVFATHSDIDHLNAIPELVTSKEVINLYLDAPSPGDNVPRAIRVLNDISDEKHLPPGGAPEKIGFEGGQITRLWPAVSTEIKSTNDASGVYLIEYAGRRVLLCSDIESGAQAAILDNYPNLRADIVLMPHHGSENTLSRAFIEALSPGIAVYSCAETGLPKNPLPCPDVKQLFTSTCGAVKISISPGGKMEYSSHVDPD